MVRYDGYKHLQEPESQIFSCIGPRGIAMNESDEDAIWAYPGTAIGELPYLPNLTTTRIDGTQALSIPRSDPTKLPALMETSHLTALEDSRRMVCINLRPRTGKNSSRSVTLTGILSGGVIYKIPVPQGTSTGTSL